MIAGIIAVESRREHIEKHILPELKNYCRQVVVFYDPTFGTTKRGDREAVKANAFANQARAYKETFANRIDNEPVILTTDDFIFAEDWKAQLDRIMAIEKGCPVYCLYTSRQPQTDGKGYWRGISKMGFYDVATVFDVPFNIYEAFEQWQRINSHMILSNAHLQHHDNLFGYFLADEGMDLILVSPSLVKHTLKSEMGHGNSFKNNFIDDQKEAL